MNSSISIMSLNIYSKIIIKDMSLQKIKKQISKSIDRFLDFAEEKKKEK